MNPKYGDLIIITQKYKQGGSKENSPSPRNIVRADPAQLDEEESVSMNQNADIHTIQQLDSCKSVSISLLQGHQKQYDALGARLHGDDRQNREKTRPAGREGEEEEDKEVEQESRGEDFAPDAQSGEQLHVENDGTEEISKFPTQPQGLPEAYSTH